MRNFKEIQGHVSLDANPFHPPGQIRSAGARAPSGEKPTAKPPTPEEMGRGAEGAERQTAEHL